MSYFYRYKHDCGFETTQSLNQDKESIVLNCLRCGRGVTAHQVRDKTVTIRENNEVKGVFKNVNGGHHANQR